MLVRALFDTHAGLEPVSSEVDEDGTEVRIEDHRTTQERQYDAVMAMVRAGLDSGEPDGPGLEPEIRIVATTDQFDGEPDAGRAHVDGLGLCR